MNITTVINKIEEKLNIKINTEYYSKIDDWHKWWCGYNDSFHKYTEMADNGKRKERDMYSLKMAKKVCEDWAAYLINEKTRIIIDDKASSEFVQGENETGGIFAEVSFWQEANMLVEKAFYSGTGAFVLKIDNMPTIANGAVVKSTNTKLRMEYLPASCIVPITVKNGNIIEAAFVSEDIVKGKKHVYVELHTVENAMYVIENMYFKYEGGNITKAEVPNGVAQKINTGSPYAFFAIIKPNMVNPNLNNAGLGCSVFSQAIDCLKGVDLAYNNFCRDFWLGGKKVFYNRELTKTIGVDEDGKTIYITPDDMMQSLFVSVGDEVIDEKKLIQEFNPDLRVEDNSKGVQSHLDFLAFKCGMGTRHYKFSGDGKIVTATQYAGEKQELKQNATKHGIVIEKALTNITKAILWIGNNILGLPVKPDAKITVEFSDGYIVSDEEKRETDRRDIQDGIMQPWEYRVKWYGEEEETAKQITQEKTIDTFGGFKYPVGEDGL